MLHNDIINMSIKLASNTFMCQMYRHRDGKSLHYDRPCRLHLLTSYFFLSAVCDDCCANACDTEMGVSYAEPPSQGGRSDAMESYCWLAQGHTI